MANLEDRHIAVADEHGHIGMLEVVLPDEYDGQELNNAEDDEPEPVEDNAVPAATAPSAYAERMERPIKPSIGGAKSNHLAPPIDRFGSEPKTVYTECQIVCVPTPRDTRTLRPRPQHPATQKSTRIF